MHQEAVGDGRESRLEVKKDHRALSAFQGYPHCFIINIDNIIQHLPAFDEALLHQADIIR